MGGELASIKNKDQQREVERVAVAHGQATYKDYAQYHIGLK